MSAHRRLLYFSYELPVFILLLGLLVASSVSADPVVNGIVGESVVLPAGFSQQSDITGVEWSFGPDVIANEGNINGTKQFKDRVHLNRRDWSLTINLLRAEDSGEYNCAFETATGQLPTHAVILRVYEKIESEVTRKPSNETCHAMLLCTTNQRENVSYRWKRGDQDLPEHAGILEASLSPGERNVTFTCIASNPVSEATASIRESCDCIAFVAESSGGVSFCVLKTVLLSVGLVLMISAVIGVHVRDCTHTKRNVRRHRAACET
ncbi:SLAM family member 5-like isoform X2 [Acipenser ruthenus]|uniref:SLAM family member 5-like isoform X2 n=1 Tax=Acipenser ruthenus TaxID=7906 RepID=UPI002741C2C7|nr:SLAM family member 5-like isoform X2 [Acipenser ruthenus]